MQLLSSTFDIIVILLGFGLLIFVHEMGHFLAAKWAGIRTEAFAIGMGPVVCSWRKGVGFALGSTHRKVVAKTGKDAHELSGAELDTHGVGETEYSLRWVPIGGFVKMLGQEDANPTAVSEDPRSYTQRPIGKRMVVVAAGVIMNLLLAAALFVFVFLAGVPLLAPVIGDVDPSMPAASAVASNAADLGVTEPGLHPGDRVVKIDGKRRETFADLQIASAMSKPGVPIELEVNRPATAEPLLFSVLPEKDPMTGLLSIGVAPGASTTLQSGEASTVVQDYLDRAGLVDSGVVPGMRMTAVGGEPIEAFEQFRRAVESSDGEPTTTTWSAVDRHGEAIGPAIDAVLPVRPEYQRLVYTDQDAFDNGLLGLTPLVRIRRVDGNLNADALKPGDLVLRVGDVDGPRMVDFRRTIQETQRGPLPMLVLRNGREESVTATVRKGKLGVFPEYAWDLPMAAAPLSHLRGAGGESDRPSAVVELDLPPRTRFDAVNGTPVGDWPALRRALQDHTAAARTGGSGAIVKLTVTHPTPGRDSETLDLAIGSDDVDALHELAWTTPLIVGIFDPIETVRTANGNPVTALVMGVEETHKHVLLTYLTIDRLFRRSVSVKQIRGPLGIVHMGSTLLDRGFIYLVFLLAMISVNLAVINFLPIPIVDGGLFLFLVYEKIKGRPPSLAFQNAATVVGLFLIGTVFLVVTWNDIFRLLS